VKPVIVGLGNDLFADDAFGLMAARRCAALLGRSADVVESSEAGLALLDLLVGRPFAIVIDAIATGRDRPGTLYRFGSGDLRIIPSLSPHHAGLPEVLQMGRRMRLPLPDEVQIIAVEAEDTCTMGGGLTPPVAAVLEQAVDVAVGMIREWLEARGLPDAVLTVDRAA
jgi:hydrogenase maturation protease